MPYGAYAQCPCCGKMAHGREEIEALFGYRNMGDGNIIPQSYCRSCRSARCEAGKLCKAGSRAR